MKREPLGHLGIRNSSGVIPILCATAVQIVLLASSLPGCPKSTSNADIDNQPTKNGNKQKQTAESSRKQRKDSLIVRVSPNYLSLDSRKVLNLTNGIVDPRDKRDSEAGLLIIPLYNALQEKRQRIKQAVSNGKITITSHKSIPYRTITEVLYTAGQSEFSRFDLAIVREKNKRASEQPIIAIPFTFPILPFNDDINSTKCMDGCNEKWSEHKRKWCDCVISCTELALAASTKDHGSNPDVKQELPLNLAVIITNRGFHIRVAPDYALPWMKTDPEPSIPKVKDDWNWERLSQRLYEIKSLHPNESEIIIVAEDDIPYETLFKTMEIARGERNRPLFPQINFARGII